MNDSIIIGLVIVLVFGALCYYLYSRLLYSEKRVVVMENILLDLKTASESWFAPSDERNREHDGANQDHQDRQDRQDNQHQNHYSQDHSLNDLALSSEPVVSESLPEVVEHVLQQVASAESVQPTAALLQGQKVSVNYESMNIKELQAEARSKNISGVSSMRRKELIELLRKSDQSVTETASNFPVLNSFIDNAAPVDATA